MAPFQTTGNPGSQLTRALAAYFVAGGVGVWPQGAQPGQCIILPDDGLEVKTYPNITIYAHSSSHSVEYTGNETYAVTIRCKFGVAGNPNPQNLYAPRVARDVIVGKIMFGMMLAGEENGNTNLDLTIANITQFGRALATQGSAQEQQNNSDMAQFTCLFVRYSGAKRGAPDDVGCAYIEERMFEIEVAPSAIS